MRKRLVSFLAVVPAVLISLSAAAQVSDSGSSSAPAAPAAPAYNWKAYAGFSYTSLNQVNQSRYGLLGADVAITRDWGRFFGVTADGAFYPHSLGSGNPGNPTVQAVFFGPEVHGHIYDRWSLFAHALLGGEHTGGESMTPKVSFAGGAGGGVDYEVNTRWSIRAYGDDIASSFSVTNNSAELGNSPHMRRNSRAGIGVAYSF